MSLIILVNIPSYNAFAKVSFTGPLDVGTVYPKVFAILFSTKGGHVRIQSCVIKCSGSPLASIFGLPGSKPKEIRFL